MVSSTSGRVLAHLLIASRTLVSQTSSNRAMATPILIFWADRAGVLPSAMAIMATAGRKNFANFVFFILILFYLGAFAPRRGGVKLKSQKARSRNGVFPEFLYHSFWGFSGH